MKWSYDVRSPVGSSSPVVAADGTIYVGTLSAGLIAVDASGNRKWAVPTGAPIDGAPVIGPDGTVYFGGNDATLRAVAPDGHVLWTYVARSSISSSPILTEDGRIFFTTADPAMYDVTADAGRFFASCGGDPAIALGALWNCDPLTSWVGDGVQAAVIQPAFGISEWLLDSDGTAYITSGGQGVNEIPFSDGGWSYDGGWTYSVDGGVPGFGTLALAASKTLFAAADDGRLFAFDAVNGHVLWTFQTGGLIESYPATDPAGSVYFGSDDGSVYAVSAQGQKVWSLATGGPVRSSPAIGADGTLYIGSDDGKLYAVAP